MKITRPTPIVSAWLICLAILATALAVFVLADDTPTPFEEEAVAELMALDAAPPDTVRIVVMGNSIMRRATADAPSIEAELQTLGYDVAVANIAGASRWHDSYERLNDEILATEPDIVILHVEMFGSPLRGSETDLRSRVSRRLGLEDAPSTYFRQRCRAGREAAELARDIPDRLRLPAPGVTWGAEFIAEAATRDVEVYLLGVPRSDEVEALAGASLDAFHADIVRRLGTEANVTIGPRVTVGDTDYFCDYVHMNELGQARFLDQILPSLSALLDEVESQ